MERRSAASSPACPQEILVILPDDWRLDGGPSLDLDQAVEDTEAPPTSPANASFRLIWSAYSFMAIADGWAEWLLETGRLLKEDGIVVIRLAEREGFERLTGQAWDESLIGMTVVDAMEEAPQTAVFHSDWWLHSHWGRGFENVELLEHEGMRHALLSRPVAGMTAEQLERPAAHDERELAAASANVSYLRSQLDLLAKRHRHQLAEQREEMGRELMRRSFAAADLEWARRGPGSPATLAAAEYEATTSWRITRPLRALGAMVRRLR
jgi:hypothetical protein